MLPLWRSSSKISTRASRVASWLRHKHVELMKHIPHALFRGMADLGFDRTLLESEVGRLEAMCVDQVSAVPGSRLFWGSGFSN